MSTLSTTRCNYCGVRLPEENTAECPSCHRELAETDKWSELKEWRQTREPGRKRYIFRRWVIGWGCLLACAMSLGLLLKGAALSVFVFTWIAFLAGGYLMGVLYCRGVEREYADTEQKSQT